MEKNGIGEERVGRTALSRQQKSRRWNDLENGWWSKELTKIMTLNYRPLFAHSSYSPFKTLPVALAAESMVLKKEGVPRDTLSPPPH